MRRLSRSMSILMLAGCGLLIGNLRDVAAADWDRFRGPNGAGVSAEEKPAPTHWSTTENIKWKLALPGPGSSSPIVVGNRIFVTCWTGHGTPEAPDTPQEQLRRHLICVDRTTGQIVWDKAVEPELPEDEYGGMFAEHGYASHTPASDGERVYVYFGKTGALAFDMDGKQLWRTVVGKESDPRGWGSASSPILYKDMVIITASAESEALVGLNKATGEVVWRQEAAGLQGVWATPVLVPVSDTRTDLVIGVPNEIWGFNPETGKLLWLAEGPPTDSVRASLVVQGDTVYFSEGRGGSTAVRAGGKGDVTKTHVLWTSGEGSGIGTPIYYQGQLYMFNGRVARKVDAATGEERGQTRLATVNTNATPEANQRPENGGGGPGANGGPDAPGGGPNAPGGGRGRGGRGGGRGGRGFGGGQDYASPVLAGGKLYAPTRSGEVFVLSADDDFQVVASNSLAADGGDFSASPAISQGEIIIRSSKFLYCIGESK